MAHARRGDRVQPRACFDLAVKWSAAEEKDRPASRPAEFRECQAEANWPPIE